MKYHIITYGCQMNKSDSERITSVLENIGYHQASDIKEANLIMVNACSVRQSAIDRIWGQVKLLAKLKIQNEKLKTVLTGCVLKEDKRKFAKNFDLILDIKDLSKLPKKLTNVSYSSDRLNKEQKIDYLKIKPVYRSNFSAYVPIMTGCDNFCTFCVVPYTRGREVSRPVDEILCEVENLIKRDYKEIWLLGQNVNSYKSRMDTNSNARIFANKISANSRDINFPKLLKVINDIPGNFWIRFTSSHPKDFSEELINVIANSEKVTEYLNLPVQSGDNEILKKMNRPYTIEQYKATIQKIRERIPEISLSTDVIVGFPGETKKQFQNTVKLFKEIKYDMAYIAQFSPRPGTIAARMKDNIPKKEKERRWKILTKILKETALEKNKQYIGKTVEVLVDNHTIMKQYNNVAMGKTKTFKTIQFPSKKNLTGEFALVKVIDALPWGLKGEMI